MIAEIGKPFKMRFINNSNVVIELHGDIDITKLSLQLTSSTSYPSPSFSHEGGSKIKILYDHRIPCHTYFDYLFTSHGTEIGQEVVSLWNHISPYFRTLLKRVFFSMLVAALFGVAIYVDNKHNDGRIGNFLSPSVWFAGKISENEKMMKSIDTRILTNDHAIYKTESFASAEAVVNKNVNEKIEDLIDDGKKAEAEKLKKDLISLKDEYWFIGNGLFVFRSVVLKGEKPVLVNYEVAQDFCEMIGANVISVDDYTKMSGLFVYLSTIFRVDEESKIPEWTRTETIDSYYNQILMKSADSTPHFSKNIQGSIAGDITQTKAAFRCVMEESDFIEAE